ncbi:OsmC family protein [Galbibacter sp. PAP.153]|uniref:OsmC family protein n=1 Tax=Galbibacter sp. PAP.153 TaxID=3104623 RepID=UPI00300912AF
MNKQHEYKTTIRWTGNLGKGTIDYRSYERSHTINSGNKPLIQASSDPAFRGDKDKYNPEELFLSSLSSCHMLWYLHFCAISGVVVKSYKDTPSGIMEETKNGGGRFTKVVLNPVIEVEEESMKEEAMDLHHKANEYCFIANSCNFKIDHSPVVNLAVP